MKKTNIILTALVLTATLLTGCSSASAKVAPIDVTPPQKTVSSEASPAESSKPSVELTKEEAKQIALAQVPGASESDIREFEIDYDDGRLEYEGSIYFGEMEYEFEIDGYSGAIRSWEVESIYD